MSNKQNLAIIINVGTKQVSTLALLSALKYAEMPVALINCEVNGINDFEYFEKLQETLDFTLYDWPLQSHGKTLDRVFTEFEYENILCIDSDLEILNSEIIDFCKKYIDINNVFGTGFLHFSEWQINPNRLAIIEGLLMERPYMPLVLLKRKYFLEAIEAGFSFEMYSLKSNLTNTFLNKVYNKALSFLLKLKPTSSSLQNSFYSFYSNENFMLNFDTGAKIHEFLRFEKRLDFVGLPHRLQGEYVNHYHGITRYLINPSDDNYTTDVGNKIEEINKNLKTKFGVSL